MVSEIFKFMGKFPPLSKVRSPNLAAALGFAFGGIGLGIYLRSFIDFLCPIGIVIVVSTVSTGVADLEPLVGFLAGAIVAAMWGYFRVVNSNGRLTPTTR